MLELLSFSLFLDYLFVILFVIWLISWLVCANSLYLYTFSSYLELTEVPPCRQLAMMPTRSQRERKAPMAQERSTAEFTVTGNVVLPALYIFMGACLAVGALLVISQPLPFAENPILMKVTMGYLGLPVSIAIIALNVRKITTRREAIRIDERGITDRTGALASGFTPWDEISEVYLLKLKDDSFLCAVPSDYEAWLGRLSTRQRRLATANSDAGFSPIRIQFKLVTDKASAQDGINAVRRIRPDKVTRVRKPKY